MAVDRSGVAAWVRSRRIQQGLRTQRDLAERMTALGTYVDTAYIKQLEASRIAVPQQPYLGLLARALNASEIDILRATGLISEPVPSPTGSGPYPPDDPRHDILDALPDLTPKQVRNLRRLMLYVLRDEEA